MPHKTDVTALLEELRKAPLTRLRELWREHLGREPADTLPANMLRPVLAYRIQEEAHGGLKPGTARQLDAVLRGLDPNRRERQEASARFQAGTRLLREWKGRTHEVTVTAAGYVYDGQLYPSLSPIANRITGTRWSGPAFFGTRRGRPPVRAWAEQIAAGKITSLDELTRSTRLSRRYVQRILQCAAFPSERVEAMVDGDEPHLPFWKIATDPQADRPS